MVHLGIGDVLRDYFHNSNGARYRNLNTRARKGILDESRLGKKDGTSDAIRGLSSHAHLAVDMCTN